MKNLPPGFELETMPSPNLPPGFEVETPQPPIVAGQKETGQGVIQGLKEFGQGIPNIMQIGGRFAPGASGTPPPQPEPAIPSSSEFNTGRFIGQSLAGGALSSLIPGAFSESLLARMAAGGIGGGISGGIQPGGDPIQNAIFGAAGGALSVPVMETAAQFINPSVSAAAKTLVKAGARPSVGQMFGGPINDAEQAAASIPGVGDMIKNARRQPVEDLNTIAANRALAHINESIDPNTTPGRGMVAEMDRKIGNHFDQVLPHLTWQADPQFTNNVTQIIQSAALAPTQQRQLLDLIKGQFSKAGTNNTMSGQLFKEVDSKFGHEGARYIGDDDADKSKLGETIFAVQHEMRDALERANSGSPYINDLKNANAAWAEATRVRRASAAAGSKEGVFGANQLSNVVKQEALTSGQFAHGQAPMQDLSDAAAKALGGTVPDSGTPQRLLLSGGGAAAAAALAPTVAEHMGNPGAAKYVWPVIAANLAGMGIYSQSGQAILRSLLARPGVAAPIASIVRKLGPIGAASGGILGQQYSLPR